MYAARLLQGAPCPKVQALPARRRLRSRGCYSRYWKHDDGTPPRQPPGRK
jgi:hypothetical protein